MAKKVGRAYIKSTGCISNLMDGTGYEQLLREAGYGLVKDVSKADLIIINTCAFNQIKEDEVIRFIEYANTRKNDHSKILVCGCLPKINIERLQGVHKGIAFGPKDVTELRNLLRVRDNSKKGINGSISYNQYSNLKKTIYQTKRFIDLIPEFKKLGIVKRLMSPHFIYSKDVFCLKVETGCLGGCTYCAIRFAKGRAVSRPKEDIVNKFEQALNNGYQKFLLVGDEITAYGHDLSNNMTIIDIIDTLVRYSQIDTLFLESFEPSFMISHFDGVKEVLASRKIPVFCSSVQSGSDRILKLMNRQYEVGDYIQCMKEIKKQFPWIYLRNEIIVGFPGETEDDFKNTLDLVSDLNFDFVDVYEYEDRPNTVASKMSDKVPNYTKRKRRKKIVRQHWKNLILKKH